METKEKVKTIIAECLGLSADTMPCDQDLYQMEGFDSMRNVMILSRIEETFDLLIPEDDIFDIATVNAWISEVEKLKGGS